MKRHFLFLLTFLAPIALFAQSFSMEQVGKFSFPSELTSSPQGEKIAWAMNEQGKRNIYMAQAPAFEPKKLTSFDEDDGQEISSLSFTPNGEFLVFVRGGDHGGGNASSSVNAQNLPELPKVQIWAIDLQSEMIELIADGDEFSL